jgi:hypothetical protein
MIWPREYSGNGLGVVVFAEAAGLFGADLEQLVGWWQAQAPQQVVLGTQKQSQMQER